MLGFQATRGYHRPVRLSDLQPDTESGRDLDKPLPSNRPEGADQNADAEAARVGGFLCPTSEPLGGQSVVSSARRAPAE